MPGQKVREKDVRRKLTPVFEGYFEHIGKVRGETRKMKVMENAREAVANGLAGQAEIRIATIGV